MQTAPPSSAAAGQAVDAARLFETYGDQLYRYCLGRLRDREEAADAVQNTFLRVHVALEKGVVPQFESAWLYKIAHNVCLNRIDSSGRRARVETPRDLDDHDLEAALAVPANEHEALAGLADALADLPHNLRQAILLREWQGLSYEEIAVAMDTTVPAVETLLYRARKQLAAALEAGGRKTRRTLAGLLDLLGLRTLVERLGTLLSGAGVAKVAAGAALLAVGGSGVGAAIALDHASAPRPRTPTLLRTGDTVARVGLTAATAPGGGSRTATPPQRAAGKHGAAAGRGPAPSGTAHVQPTTAAAVTGAAPSPATTAARDATTAASGSTPATTAAAALQTSGPVPTVQTPTVAVPTVKTPTVQPPTLAAPTVQTPTVQTPTVQTPSVQTPTLQTPTVPGLPGTNAVSGVTTPAVTTPTVPSLPAP